VTLAAPHGGTRNDKAPHLARPQISCARLSALSAKGRSAAGTLSHQSQL